MKNKLSEKQKAVIEKYGVVFEKHGFAPAKARILGLLMVCESAELTFEEIYSTLKLSKSAVSNALSSLQSVGRVQYHTKPGDRKRYFSVQPAKITTDDDTIINKLAETAEVHREILAARSVTNKEYNNQIKTYIEFNEFLQKELKEVMKKWRNRK